MSSISFEMIRAVFHEFFRVQGSAPAPPLIIIAARDENTLKALLPEGWMNEGWMHPVGIFVRGPEKK